MTFEDLQPWETELVSHFSREGASLRADATYHRIQHLISRALSRVADRSEGWNVLYRDPQDGRYWELDYPESEMHGGGPPTLRLLNPSEVQRLYGI